MRDDYQSARDLAGKELRDVLSSTEALLAALGDTRNEAVDALRDRLTTTISDVKKQLGSSFLASARDTIHKARDTATSVDQFVTERPWTALAICAGAALLIGMVLRD